MSGPASAAPPSTQTVNRSATFSTSGQSLWDPGAAQPPTDINTPIFDAPWSKSGTAGGVDSVDFDPCFGIAGGCNQHIGSFGASLTGDTNGEIGMSYTVHGQTGGTLGVNYPVHVTFTAPADDTFAPGATVAITSSLSVDPSAHVSTIYPTFDSLSLDGKFRFHLGVSGQLCFFSCIGGNLFTIDLPNDGSTAQGAIIDLTKAQLVSIPGFGLTDCFNALTNIALGFSSYPNTRCNDNGYLAFPDVSVGTTVNGDGSLTADGTDRYVIVPVSAVAWVARLLGLPPGFPNLSAKIGDFTFSYTTLNVILTALVDEQQTLHFTPTVHVTLHLPRAMSWSVVGGGSGNSDTITYTAGQTVHLTIPTDQAGPLQISPTLSFAGGDNVSNHTHDTLSGNLEVKALQFALKIPPVSVDFGALGSFQVWDGINISAGPVYDQNFSLGSSGLYTRDNSWELGGFNSPALTPFSLTPDPPPVATAQTVAPVEGASFTGKVGHFADPDPADANNTASAEYTATIDWGDATPATGGTITGPNSSFDVTGTHTYAEEGTYPVTVTVTDNDTAGVISVAHSTATVSDALLTTTASNPLSAVEGKPFGPITFGSFTDADPAGTVSDYTATVNWGDSSTSPAVVTANGGHFDVSFPGTHTYAEEGHPNLVVHVADAGGATTNIVVSTTVADAPLHASGVTDNTTSGGTHVLMWPVPPGTGIVATFTDEDPGGVVSDYSATINWGDGTSSAGTPGAGSGGGFTVRGTHAYTVLGEHTVTITIHDEGGSVATATTTTLSFGYAPGGGSFVIGDGNAALGTDVTFWGAQWSKLNTLSGGSAPNAFKGFAASPSTIDRCSTAWSTGPGSSSDPPATVPSYMAVAVASKVTQAGSTISGNSPKLVVVHTRSGYGPAAGHTGTGTVVATICG